MQNNYYKFYGLSTRYAIDLELLRSLYLRKSKELHPDHHLDKTPAEKAAILTKSALNNVAYQVLKDDLKRLEHLFQIYGLLDTDKQNKSEIKISNEFLFEMMDVNERLDDFSTLSYSDQNSFKFEIKTLYDTIMKDLMHQMEKFDTIQNEQETILKYAFELHLQLKYILRIQERLTKFEL